MPSTIYVVNHIGKPISFEIKPQNMPENAWEAESISPLSDDGIKEKVLTFNRETKLKKGITYNPTIEFTLEAEQGYDPVTVSAGVLLTLHPKNYSVQLFTGLDCGDDSNCTEGLTNHTDNNLIQHALISSNKWDYYSYRVRAQRYRTGVWSFVVIDIFGITS